MSAYFEVQFKVSAFLAAQLTGLRSRQICPPPPQTVTGVTVRVQRIEFGANAIRHNKPATFPVFYQYHGETIGIDADGFQTQIAQDVVLHVTREDDVLSHPNQPPASVVTIPVRAVLNLDYYPLDTGCFMRTSFAGLEWGPLPALPPGVDPEAAKDMVQTLVANAVASKAVPINFANLLPGGVTKVENAGISVSDDLQRLVLRAQIGGASSYADVPWGNFYKGFILDHTAGADWALFVGNGPLEGVFTNAVYAAVKEHSVSELQLISVGSTYSNADGKAKVDTTIFANVDIPDPGGTEYVEPHVHSELSVSATNQLTVDVFLPDLQAMANELLAPVRWALRFLLGPLSTTFQLALDSAVRDIKAPEVSLPNCHEVEPLHQRCVVGVPVPAIAGAQIRFTGLAALADGIALTGRMTVPALTPPVIEARISEFTWVTPDVSCRSIDMAFVAYFSNHAEQVAPVAADVVLDNTGTTPVYLCDVRVLNDTLGKFPASGVRWLPGATLPTRIVVEVPNPGPQYAAARYPVDLLVATTAGARLVRLPPAPALTQADIDRLVALLIGMLGNCFQLVHPRYDLRWLFDPPFDKEVEHHWQIEIDGRRIGDLVQVADPAGNVIAEATVNAGDVARLTAVVAAAAGPELRVMRAAPVAPAVRRAGAEPARGDDDVGVGIRQQVLEVEAAIPLDGVGRQVVASSTFAPRGVLVVLDDGLAAFDLSTPALSSRRGPVAHRRCRGGVSLAAGRRGRVVRRLRERHR